jgi:hypothetical protein
MNARHVQRDIIVLKLERILPAVCVHQLTTVHQALLLSNRSLVLKENTVQVEVKNQSYVQLAHINLINVRIILMIVCLAQKVCLFSADILFDTLNCVTDEKCLKHA